MYDLGGAGMTMYVSLPEAGTEVWYLHERFNAAPHMVQFDETRVLVKGRIIGYSQKIKRLCASKKSQINLKHTILMICTSFVWGHRPVHHVGLKKLEWCMTADIGRACAHNVVSGGQCAWSYIEHINYGLHCVRMTSENIWGDNMIRCHENSLDQPLSRRFYLYYLLPRLENQAMADLESIHMTVLEIFGNESDTYQERKTIYERIRNDLELLCEL